MNTPIFNYLRMYANSGILPFHMPGHKMGKGFPYEFSNLLAAIDITEIPGADYLHQPVGIIKEAQELAAEAFGSDRAFFLVNGSTCGVYAMIQTICKPGDSLIVARDCHKSVINGMMLSGVRPVYIMPEYDHDLCITTHLKPEKLIHVMDNNRDAVGVLITRPTYYGVCSDLAKIADIVHARGKVLAVDEAHGAHLRFNKGLPICAMDAGADICVQSGHKTLPALTQGAFLHVKSNSVDIEKLYRCLELFQTSSPSYLLLASLDIARAIMQNEGSELLENLLKSIIKHKAGFIGRDMLFLNDRSDIGYSVDMTRIVANLRGLCITGYDAEKFLRASSSIQIEMADPNNIVCITTIADDETTIDRLFSSLENLIEKFKDNADNKNIAYALPDLSNMIQVLSLGEVLQSKAQRVSFDEAIGRISKDMLAPYPPGIPVVCPGEIISREVVYFLKDTMDAGGKVNGIDENLGINVI